MKEESNYMKYRGKCLQMAKDAMLLDPELKLIRGYYYCLLWNKKEMHWWTVRLNGEIYDPTKDQFPSRGHGDYEEFNGMIECPQCGEKVPEEHAVIDGNYAYCSVNCHGKYIGAIL